MQEDKNDSAKYRARANRIHVWLAIVVAVALVIHINLWAIDASPEVVGGGMFLLVFPALLILVFGTKAVVFSVRGGGGWRLVLLNVLLFLNLILLFVSSTPGFLIAIAFEATYILLVIVFFLQWL